MKLRIFLLCVFLICVIPMIFIALVPREWRPEVLAWQQGNFGVGLSSNNAFTGQNSFSNVYSIDSVVYCDGSKYPSLNAANTAAGSTGTIIIPKGSSCPLTANLVELNYLIFQDRSQVTLGAFNLTLGGPITAEMGQQIFNLNGAGVVNLSTIFPNDRISPMWWGAKCDYATDDLIPFNAMMTAVSGNARPITMVIPNGCVVSGTVNMAGIKMATVQGTTPYSIANATAQYQTLKCTGNGTCFSLSGTVGVTITGVGFYTTNASFTGPFIALGPTQSSLDHIQNNALTIQANTTNAIAVTADTAIDSFLEFNNFFVNPGATGTVFMQGAASNSSFTVRMTIRGNACNTNQGAVGAVCIQNFTNTTWITENDVEIGNGSACTVPIAYTSGTWSGTSLISGLAFKSNFVGDGGVANSCTLFSIPANSTGLDFEDNAIGPNVATVNIWNFGNNSSATIKGNTDAPSTVLGTRITIGTGVVLNVVANSFTGTQTTFLSGTPALGSFVIDSNGINRTNPQIVSNAASASVNANITATTLVTAPALNANCPANLTANCSVYEINWYIDVSAVGTSCTGSTTVVLNFLYTDPLGAGQQTVSTSTITIATNGNGTAGTLVANGSQIVVAKLSTTVQYSTTGFTAGTGCSPAPKYQVTPIVKQIS